MHFQVDSWLVFGDDVTPRRFQIEQHKISEYMNLFPVKRRKFKFMQNANKTSELCGGSENYEFDCAHRKLVGKYMWSVCLRHME